MSAVRSGIAVASGLIATLLFLQGTTQAQSAPHDLRFIADKPLLAIWSHPTEHLKNPVLAALIGEIKRTPPAKGDLSEAFVKMDLLRMSLSLGNSPWTDKPIPQHATIVHFTDPAATKIFFESVSKGMEARNSEGVAYPIYTRTFAAIPGEPAKDWKLFPSAALLNPSTAVEADTAELLLKVTAPASATAPPAWAKDLATLANTQTTVFIDLVQVRDQMKEAGPPPGQGGIEGMIFNSVKSLWEQADYAFVSFDTTNGIQLSAQAQSPNAESAQRFKGALEGILALAKGFLPTAKQAAQQLNQINPGLGEMAYTELENLVNSIKITQTGMQTKLTLGIPQETLAKVPALVLPALKSAREQAMAMQSMNNLRQIAIALQNYEATHRAFPAAVILGPDGKTPHSWRVAILPFIEEQALYNQYKFDEPWDSENNKKVAATIPQVYRSANATNGANCASYVALTHPDGVFNATPAAKGTAIRQVTDGLSKTIAIVEANAEIPWTKPEDLPLVDGQPLPQLGLPGASAFNAAFCDGAVQQLTTKLTDEFRKLVTKSDGNVVDVETLQPQEDGPPRRPQAPGDSPFDATAPTKSAVPVPAPPAIAPPVPAPALPVPAPGIPAPPRVNP